LYYNGRIFEYEKQHLKILFWKLLNREYLITILYTLYIMCIYIYTLYIYTNYFEEKYIMTCIIWKYNLCTLKVLNGFKMVLNDC